MTFGWGPRVEKQPNEGDAKGCKLADMLIGGQHVLYITWDTKPVRENPIA
jgi:hypothetical protein